MKCIIIVFVFGRVYIYYCDTHRYIIKRKKTTETNSIYIRSFSTLLRIKRLTFHSQKSFASYNNTCTRVFYITDFGLWLEVEWSISTKIIVGLIIWTITVNCVKSLSRCKAYCVIVEYRLGVRCYSFEVALSGTLLDVE